MTVSVEQLVFGIVAVLVVLAVARVYINLR
jgi:hypothetical protein